METRHEVFMKLYTKNQNYVLKICKAKKRKLIANGVFHQWQDAEDMAQDVWLAVWEAMLELPHYEYVGDEEWLNIGFGQVNLMGQWDRRWDREHRGEYVIETPINPDEIFKLMSFVRAEEAEEQYQNGALCKEIEWDLKKKCTPRQWELYNNYFRYNQVLSPKQKNTHEKHYTGWTHQELAESYGVTRQMITKEYGAIVNKLKETMKESGFEVK